MKTGRRVHVSPAPSVPATTLLSATDLRSALDEVRSRFPAGTPRLAIWTDAPEPRDGPDIVVCVPVVLLENRRAQAEQVVARWDAAWLLIESATRAYRDAAHQHLVDEISVALLASAIEGVEDASEDDEEDLGF